MKFSTRYLVCCVLILAIMAGCAGNNAGMPGADADKSVSTAGSISLNNTGTYTYLPWNATCTSSISQGSSPHAFYVLKSADGTSVLGYVGSYNTNNPSYPQTIPDNLPVGYYRLYVYQESLVSGQGYVDAGSDWCYVIDRTN